MKLSNRVYLICLFLCRDNASELLEIYLDLSLSTIVLINQIYTSLD